MSIGQNHTPGPWEAHSSIYEHMAAEVRAVMPGEERGIAQVWSHKNSLADARLLAAAPDLLKACKELLVHSIRYYGNVDQNNPIGMEQQNARDAIARATGWR